MARLGDFLGQLVSEITIARMHSDLEMVRVAELYASHPLLRTLPAPHFRLPEVELEVPVVIKQVEQPPESGPPRGGAKPEVLRQTFHQVLAKRFLSDRIHTTPASREKLRSAIDGRLAAYSRPTEIAGDVMRFAEELAEVTVNVLKEGGHFAQPAEASKGQKLRQELKETARREFLKARTPPPRLEALVTTSAVREAGPSEVVTHLRLKVTEHGVEWREMEGDGGVKERLVPE